eukprot:TRINITY_DN34787_c0_g1_i1.p1 TRINITY_DN34787_c0_g1~~TRINITY_DN34787_c0_g1_i1.p1  ORF type:complete len:286 (+),score=36.46 TRINITY_DN34787_c0_g1_i1:66-923(+)
MGEKEYWEETQELVQPLIPRPQLTEKLLKKPPFRFVHDIFTNLTAATGFGEGLLQGSNLDSASFSEKSAKAACLKRIIHYVSLVNGSDVNVDPKQMVSGREPERSNEFLRDMARAVKTSRDTWYEALDTIKEKDLGDTTEVPPPPPPPDEESIQKKSQMSIDTKLDEDSTRDRTGKPTNWENMIKEATDLRAKAEQHGADVNDCKTFSNKALGAEILEIQKEITIASRAPIADPLTPYDLPEKPEDVDKLVELIEEQLSSVRLTNEMMQANELILDRLTKGIIPH